MPPAPPHDPISGLKADPADRLTTSSGGGQKPPEPPARPPKKRPRRGRPSAEGSPKPARKGKKRGWLGLVLTWGATAAIWAAILVALVIGYYGYDLPDLQSLTATQRRPSITLLSADGETIAAFGDVYGETVGLADLPPYLPQAVMATEDRHFYSHFGIDLIGLLRAAFADLKAGHVVQGGSTLTQQLAKNLFLTPERSLKRKIQELLVALWLEHKFSKDQILTLYLNRVYLGSGSWGVDAAARRYFGIPASRLDLYQSALLAGLLKAPSRYNPQNDQELSAKRTAQVLANMVAFGAISQHEADQALASGPGSVPRITHTGRYFADWVHDLVDQYAHGDHDIVVHTTLDMALERKVEADLDAFLAGPGVKGGVSQGAVVVLSPDGAVRAMAGGRDYGDSQFNRAVQGMRQPGSSFKAFLYLAALEAGWTEQDSIEDTPITEGKYRPADYGHKYEGAISLREAFAKSSNVAAVRLIERVGPKRVVEVARRLGITADLRPDASLALGTSEVSPLEMTAGYAAFANGGNGVFAYGFTDIVDPKGQSYYHREGGGAGRVIAAGPLYQMTDMMSAVVAEGTGKAAAIDRPVAGKTGTTQDYKDAWFLGFSADYVAGVWMGNDDNRPMHRITGGSLPAQLWHQVMLAANSGLPVRPLPGLDQSAGGNEASESAAEPGAPARSLWDNLVHLLGG